MNEPQGRPFQPGQYALGTRTAQRKSQQFSTSTDEYLLRSRLTTRPPGFAWRYPLACAQLQRANGFRLPAATKATRRESRPRVRHQRPKAPATTSRGVRSNLTESTPGRAAESSSRKIAAPHRPLAVHHARLRFSAQRSQGNWVSSTARASAVVSQGATVGGTAAGGVGSRARRARRLRPWARPPRAPRLRHCKRDLLNKM